MFWNLKKIEQGNEEATITKDIILKMLDRNDVEKIISPKSDEYFLIDKINEYCVVICDDKIILANHKFSTIVELGFRYTESIKKIVKDRLEEERQVLKATLFENKLTLLHRIKESI